MFALQIVHNKRRPYLCNTCGHETSRKAMLDLHLRTHTGEKPYRYLDLLEVFFISLLHKLCCHWILMGFKTSEVGLFNLNKSFAKCLHRSFLIYMISGIALRHLCSTSSEKALRTTPTVITLNRKIGRVSSVSEEILVASFFIIVFVILYFNID